MERNALCYAGHTVWNRHAEGGDVNGGKFRPREEWVIQRDPHPALITEAEAEALLTGLASRKSTSPIMRRDSALLSGLLKAPDGKVWWSDGPGAYRYGKARRVSRPQLDAAVMECVMEHLQAPVFVRGLHRALNELTDDRDAAADLKAAKAELAKIDGEISRQLDLAAQMSVSGPVLRKVEAMEIERQALAARVAAAETRATRATKWVKLDEARVRASLAVIAAEIADSPPERVRDSLMLMIDEISLDPASLACEIRYRVKGNQLASPRRTETSPLDQGPEVVLTMPGPRLRAA